MFKILNFQKEFIMKFSRTFFLFTLIFSLITFAFAQPEATESKTEKDETKAELEKKALDLVEKTVGDASTLKLWENRALAYAIAGDLVWKNNQKRAKALFRDSADELIRGANEPKKNENNFFWMNRSPRHIILLLIASNDADLALNLMLETRPNELQKAIDEKNIPKVKSQKQTSAQLRKQEANRYKVQEELRIEQLFAVKAAEQDPSKAAKLIRKSLEKGVSMSAINLVRKVDNKDEDLAKELMGEVIDKLLSSQFKEQFNSELQVATSILRESQMKKPRTVGKEKLKPLKFEEKDLKAIAEKVADFYLKATNYQMFWSLSSTLSLLEKYVPNKIPQLKQKEKEVSKLFPESLKANQESWKMLSDPNAKPEDLMKEARNQNNWQKTSFYRRAIDKFIDSGQGDKARQLLKAEPESKQKTEALDYLNDKLSQKAIKNNKLEEARNIVNQAETESSKVKLLVDLAIGFEKKNTEEDHKNALELMEEASLLVNEIPESRKEVGDILKVASGFAYVKPDRVHTYLNNLIYMANDLITAYALIAKYNKRSNMFKNGEMIFTQSVNRSYMNYGKAIQKLAEKDFDKVESLIDQFQRQDARILAKLLIAQGIIKGKIHLEGMRQYYVSYSN